MEEARGAVSVPVVIIGWIGPKNIKNPTQIALLLELATSGVGVGSDRFVEIARQLSVSVATIEAAARALVARGAVSRTRIGRRHAYAINYAWEPEAPDFRLSDQAES